MSIQIRVFDGANSIGGTKIHLLAENVGLFLDFGMNFQKYGLYFEEFLKPRSARGIYDFLTLKLIPPLENLYRQDLFPADLKIESGLKPKVDAIFLSHAHMDHCGNAGLFDIRIPLYSSTTTAVIVKAMQDSGQLGFESEIAYISPRAPAKDNPLVITAQKEANCKGRALLCVDNPDFSYGSAFKDFFQKTYSSKKLDWVLPSQAKGRIENLKFKAFPVDHSIFGATSYAFETPLGWIAYTGDFRIHGTRKNLSLKMIEELKKLKPRLLIVEGTNIGEETKKATEEKVFENCLEKVREASGQLVIADFVPRNIERLLTFLKIAKEVNRRLVILPKDAYLLQAMRLVDKNIPDLLGENHLYIFDETKVSQNLWEKDFIRKKYQHKYVRASKIQKNQEEFILAFSFWDLKHLLDIMPRRAVYIYSASEAFSEEQEFDLWRMSNWLHFLGIKPVGFNLARSSSEEGILKPEFVEGYHSSGHISGNELIEIIKEIKPKTLMPVHTEDPQLFVEKLQGEVEIILPKESEPIELR